ncbi:4'-phosphopantetheinyl transferase family protein [Kitasatospora kifunensis]|uniref:4'-phosphopantetheinyl transferase n=1 Tax=Kitasatospora kifunensis TaxID=58351 RepID=A0A7W7VWR9_KITKI|nr:4'-phosphopantetheinyl transferase superfamily protein [Kitasatospora kifunensis]MBB4925726.1 4'-phosphopantetheinyl transferase [Kitasatospora kifunensis]
MSGVETMGMGALAPGQVEVAWIAVTPANVAAAEAADAAGVLDAAERQRAAAFRRDSDRSLYQVAHLALRRLLAERLGRDPAAVTFRRAPCPGCGQLHGRPEPVDAPGLEFSLSHSGDLALIALAADPVGADVERADAFAPGAGAEVANQLHPAERAELAALAERSPQRWAAAAVRCWVRKEAYLKGTGMGLGRGVEHDYVGLGPGFGTAVRAAQEPPTGALPQGGVLPPGGALPPAGWELRAVEVPSGYDAAIALRLPSGLPGEAVRVRSAELLLT